MKKFSAAIIGCGKVAGMYGNDGNTNIQSHAQAYQDNPRTKLTAVFDPNKEQLERFCKKWNIENGYNSLDQMMSNEKIEIVSICSPTSFHYEHFSYLSKIPVSGIFAEKPIANDLNEAKKIVELTKNIPVAINYFRRWNSELQNLKKDINRNTYGKLHKIILHHTKGIRNNGSHVIDLMNWFFGEIKLKKVINKYEINEDDLGVDCLLITEQGAQIILSHIPSVDYVYMNIEFICELGIINLCQRGQEIKIFVKEKDPDYRVFNRLVLKENKQTKWQECFTNAITNITKSIQTGEQILCTPEDAYKSSVLCEKIIQS